MGETVSEQHVVDLVEDQSSPTIFISGFGNSPSSLIIGCKSGEFSTFDLKRDYPLLGTFNTDIKKVAHYCLEGSNRELVVAFSADQGASVFTKGAPNRHYFPEPVKQIIFVRAEGDTLILADQTGDLLLMDLNSGNFSKRIETGDSVTYLLGAAPEDSSQVFLMDAKGKYLVYSRE